MDYAISNAMPLVWQNVCISTVFTAEHDLMHIFFILCGAARNTVGMSLSAGAEYTVSCRKFGNLC